MCLSVVALFGPLFEVYMIHSVRLYTDVPTYLRKGWGVVRGPAQPGAPRVNLELNLKGRLHNLLEDNMPKVEQSGTVELR
jgi:hypothetical protein